MAAESIESTTVTQAALTLFDEAHIGPQGKGSWFTESTPGSGFFGALDALSADAASKPLHQGSPISAASHADHIRYALELANRAAAGESPYKDADWSASWKLQKVSDAEWKDLRARLRKEYEKLRASIAAHKFFGDLDSITGLFSLIAHTAWHLGAVNCGSGRIVIS